MTKELEPETSHQLSKALHQSANKRCLKSQFLCDNSALANVYTNFVEVISPKKSPLQMAAVEIFQINIWLGVH